MGFHSKTKRKAIKSNLFGYLCAVVSVGILGSWKILTGSSTVLTYQSDLCGCNRSFQFKVPTNESIVHWCSEEATSRGPHQNVVAYSLYVDRETSSIGTKYHLIFDTIPEQVRHFYPNVTNGEQETEWPEGTDARQRGKWKCPGIILGTLREFWNQGILGNQQIHLSTDWRVRVYFNFHPNQTEERQSLCAAYCSHDNVDICDVRNMAVSLHRRQKEHSLPVLPVDLARFNRMNWRYLAIFDPSVDNLLIRDADSEVNSREMAAVNQWLQSGHTFHVMRDHPHHSFPIMGGLFGMKLHRDRRLLESLMRAMVSLGNTEKYLHDQVLLSRLFWPTVKDDAMIHDSYTCQDSWNSGRIVPFPTQRDANKTFVSDRSGSDWTRPTECPVACRPPEHQDWEFC